MIARDQLRFLPRIACRPFALALAVLALFATLQIATLSYGTRINDIPYISDARVPADVLRGSALDRGHVVQQPSRAETPDLWMVRYKLYSTEADEIVSIMALARIKPAEGQFDPGFYQYGGAYLYLLGAWYFALTKLGLVHVGPFEEMLANPQDMDRVWIAGRALILAAFLLSGALFFVTMNTIAPVNVALAALTIYLFCPASIMFSEVIKPHWYALLWINAAVLIVVCVVRERRLPMKWEVTLGICIGLAVGSVSTNTLLAVGLWLTLAWLVVGGAISIAVLVRVPLIALAAFVCTNPYYLLNWHSVQAERSITQGWFAPAASIDALAAFVGHALIAGLGITLTALMIAVALWRLLRGPAMSRLLALALLVPIIAVAFLTAHTAGWIQNFRYTSYLLPIGLIAIAIWRVPAWLFMACAAATVVQAAPLKLAYSDENSAAHSTRLSAAAWINANVPKSDTICLPNSTMVPFDAPPFDFTAYRVNTDNCRWVVRVERDQQQAREIAGYAVAKRFTPRLSPALFPLVWEHINPQITVYRKNG